MALASEGNLSSVSEKLLLIVDSQLLCQRVKYAVFFFEEIPYLKPMLSSFMTISNSFQYCNY